MTPPIDPLALLRALAEERIDYVVIGGFAVIAYGVARVTRDLDICPDPDPANLARLAAWLDEIGAVQMGAGDFDVNELPFDPARPEDLAQGGNFRLETPLGILDVMQWIAGVEAEPAFALLSDEAVLTEVDGIPVRIASLGHLRDMKRAAGRPQDLADLADLAIAHPDEA